MIYLEINKHYIWEIVDRSHKATLGERSAYTYHMVGAHRQVGSQVDNSIDVLHLIF
jgi:hypothetical protein